MLADREADTQTDTQADKLVARTAQLLCPDRGAEYCDEFAVCLCVWLSANIPLEPLDRSSRSLLHRFLVAVARSSSGGVAIRYAFPVLWMTSRLVLVGRMVMRG